jgi:hypothetical protein
VLAAHARGAADLASGPPKIASFGPDDTFVRIGETSNMPTPSRTALCSATMPVGYCTGISYPAKGTIFAPRRTCSSCSGVRFSAVSLL